MLMYGFYNYWRASEEPKGAGFVLYILAATVYSTYACAWVRAAFGSAFEFGFNSNITQDYLTDWSVLRSNAKYPLLRNELLCADCLPVSE